MADNDPNKTFIAKLGQGNRSRLRILLSPKPQPPKPTAEDLARESNRRKFLGTSYKRRPLDEIIPRTPHKNLVNFWDLGQLADGSDIDFLINTTPGVPFSFGFDPVFTPSWNDLSPAGWTQLSSTIYGVDMDDWDTVYHKLGYEEAEDYGLDVYFGDNVTFEADKYFPVGRNGSRFQMRTFMTGGSFSTISGSKWTDKGLEIPNGLSTFSVSCILSFVNTHAYAGGMVNTYMTATNDPGDTPVSTTFSGNVDVFLYPMPVFEIGYESDTATSVRKALNGFFTTMPRSFYLGRYLDFTEEATETTTAFGCPAFAFDNEVQQSLHTDLIDFMKARPEARVYDYYTGTTLTLDDFPVPSLNYYAGHTAFQSGQYPALQTIIYGQSPVAVIRNKGNWYWVWNDTADRQGWASLFSMAPE